MNPSRDLRNKAVEMAQITPPIGFNLFVLQGMTGGMSRSMLKLA